MRLVVLLRSGKLKFGLDYHQYQRKYTLSVFHVQYIDAFSEMAKPQRCVRETVRALRCQRRDGFRGVIDEGGRLNWCC